MIRCREYRHQFSEALYHELSQEKHQLFQGHLNTCSSCADEFAKMKSALTVLDDWQRPSLPPKYWQEYWQRLNDRLPAPMTPAQSFVRGWRQWLPRFHFESKWAYQAAAACAILLIGIFVGRTFFNSPVPSDRPKKSFVQSVVMTTKDQELSARTVNYLERSKILLLGLVNFDPQSDDAQAIDLPYQKILSRRLVQEASILKDELNSPNQQRLRDLIQDLEIILLQIANMESESDLPAIELVKSGVDHRAILLKINLEEMRQSPPSTNSLQIVKKKKDQPNI